MDNLIHNAKTKVILSSVDTIKVGDIILLHGRVKTVGKKDIKFSSFFDCQCLCGDCHSKKIAVVMFWNPLTNKFVRQR